MERLMSKMVYLLEENVEHTKKIREDMKNQRDEEKKDALKKEYATLKKDFIGKVLDIKNAKEAGLITAKEAADLLYGVWEYILDLLSEVIKTKIARYEDAVKGADNYKAIISRLQKKYFKEYMTAEEYAKLYPENDEIGRE